MLTTELKVPELGENIQTADVIRVLISVGQEVQKDQPILELETQKAVFELPSSLSGKVEKVLVKPGDKVKVGQVLFLLSAEKVERDSAPQKVGAGFKPAPTRVSTNVGAIHPPNGRRTGELPLQNDVYASPIVRRIAREMNVDLSQVKSSSPSGRITIEDVARYAKPVGAGLKPAPTLPDFSKWGATQKKSMSSVRRATAEHLSTSWNLIPHVTQFDRADITELEKLRTRFAKRAEAAGVKLTVMAILLKTVASALKVFPQMNASLDMQKEEVIYKDYCHIGIAVDTERGLIVPVIRDVDQKNILELAKELKEISEKARNKKTTLEEMQGASFTITNLGSIGGTHFTPIINWPQVAILGLGRSSVEPVFVKRKFQAKTLLPLSLSYDHRLIDGADAARFLRWLAEALQQPFLIDLEG